MLPLESHVLVIGAYGLIGHGIASQLEADGMRVTGMGRDLVTGRRVLPELDWICRDLRDMTEPEAWRAVLPGVTTVVNCSGALQDSGSDDLESVHHHMVKALAQTCAEMGVALIQISAVGAREEASTSFLASKARGDAAIRASGARYHIFHPGLVLASGAYGGSNLLRMLAAVPWVQPLALADAQIQTVALDDVASAVVSAVNGRIPPGAEVDLVEDEAQPLREVVATMRHWLGVPPARWVCELPDWTVHGIAKVADALAWLGWRAPLRSTALRVLTEGVLGTPPSLDYGGPSLKPLKATLTAMPASAQDRLHARMALMMPVAVAVMSLFWIISGLVGAVQLPEAARVLETVGWPVWLAQVSVLFWAVVDVAIGLAFAHRRTTRAACLASFAVCLIYLGASTLVVPGLWTDPLGPLVKIVPIALVSLMLRAVLESR